ncbi:MAG: monovalent cation/H+ antiporter subunit D family protein, partial [Alphaproteobacteria bacterium]|nr:monovalent cation/H+ antiporter subunit D family protein [Alphaproteobacteria bacterium]
MIAQFPALQVVIPLIGAPLCIILRRGALPWLIALLVSWVALAIAASLLSQVADGTIISYAIGGWLAPLGIEYRIDVLNAFMMVLVTGTSSIVLP